MSVAVVAEKPSVARDLARVLGAQARGQGLLSGNGYVVTWAIGHLVALAQPHEIRPEWKRWARELLPILPEEWPLVVLPDTREQFDVVSAVLRDPQVERVVCATDAGREGELIFRYLYEKARCRKPVQRLWLSSLTPEAIRQGFARLRPGREFDPLADAARGRSRADWLVGMNVSRATTLAHAEMLHVGRVQTPTLAMLVERELAIRSFVPEDYLEVVATFETPPAARYPDTGRVSCGAPTTGGPRGTGERDVRPCPARYKGTWFRGPKPSAESRRLDKDGVEAARLVARARAGTAEVESKDSQTRRVPPPLLYDLTELQRHANRLYGMSARETLAAAQSLYEEKKLLSYPRTDSRHLSTDVAATLPAVVKAIAAPYATRLAPGTGERPLSRRFVDDAQVSDHHALIPTTVSAGGAALTRPEQRIYDLVCRRLLMAWHAEHVFAVTTVITRVTGPARDPEVDRYHSSGTVVEAEGWKVLEVAPAARPKGEEEEQALPAGLQAGLPVLVIEAEAVPRRTRPPRRFTDATLLTAMETAGRTLDERELAEAMKDGGLGTPATRAEIIETLVRRGYVDREGRALAATDKGIRLVERVHPDVKSPALTGEWEAQLRRIQRGQGDLASFMKAIEAHIRRLVDATLAAPPPAAPMASPIAPAAAPPLSPPPVAPPPPSRDMTELLTRVFRLQSFRARQEEVCRAVAEGKDVLLVMPTGAGKSLCYQLPGLVRGGTTVVVSPLIAIMEDQVAKLRALGLRAERIHSGRERGSAREVLAAYGDGRLDYLFVAPERFGTAGFVDTLARRTPALLAIDEAHCISEWGHDFRPDYRLLGQHVPRLRPAPVIALTATATPRVQDDVAAQLGLKPVRHIHGFRRENIAIEVVEMPPAARGEAVQHLLADRTRRPAIVYTPTRREADALGLELKRTLRAATYHAGLATDRRERVQADFQAGRLEVVVATIAFGMGIDKADIRTVVHTALPGSLEAYSQEVGRAGRDGEPSRALLLHSWNDRRTHEFFLEKGYPEVEVLERLFQALGPEARPVAEAGKRARIEPEVLEVALEKLWVHGGAVVTSSGTQQLAARGADGWQARYRRQREHRQAQVDEVQRFVARPACRMAALVRHFGDSTDAGRPCGTCDVCAPAACLVRATRAPGAAEKKAASVVLQALRERDGQAAGRLHALVDLERGPFQDVLAGLARAGTLRLTDETFQKDGQKITYQRVWLAGVARAATVEPEFTLAASAAPGKRAARRAGRKRGAAKPKGRPRAPAAETGLVADLKGWRLKEARRAGIPAFRILRDATLLAIAAERPQDEDALLAIPGMGPALLGRYGRPILVLCRQA